MNKIDKLTEELHKIADDIVYLKKQLSILNEENRYYSFFVFQMSAKMSSFGNSEMPSEIFELPAEIKKHIVKLYKKHLETKIEEREKEREQLVIQFRFPKTNERKKKSGFAEDVSEAGQEE